MNLNPLRRPPHAPELNAIERVWEVWVDLRERFRSPRLWPTCDDIPNACGTASNALIDGTGRIRSSAQPRLGRTGRSS